MVSTEPLRLSLRLLAKHPRSTLATVLVLTLGIGVNTTLAGVIHALLAKPLPAIGQPERVVAVFAEERERTGVACYADLEDMRQRSRTLSHLAAHKRVDIDLSLPDRPERIVGLMVTSQYFDTLGVAPRLGRFFAAQEGQRGAAARRVVLSEPSWQRRFAADPAVLGRTLTLNGQPFTVIGVAPPRFRGAMLGELPEVFVSFSDQPVFMPGAGDVLESRGWCGVFGVGRLADGQGLFQAAAELNSIQDQLRAEHPRYVGERRIHLLPLREATLPPSSRQGLVSLSTVLSALGFLVFLSTVLNVSTLLTGRSAERQREMAVRRALGASGRHLATQLLVEGLLLALAGGLLSLILALWTGDLLGRSLAFFAPDLTPDAATVLFALVLSLAAGLGCALLPVLAVFRGRTIGVLKAAAPLSGGSKVGSRPLVVVQVGLSLVLMVATGLLLRSLNRLERASGLPAERLLVAQLDPARQGYDAPALVSFYDRLLERAAGLPGAESVALTTSLLGAGVDSSSIHIEGVIRRSEEPLSMRFGAVAGDYFQAVGQPVLRGRSVAAEDGPTAPLAVVLNETAARLVAEASGRDPLTARISLESPQGPLAHVVGIVPDRVSGSLRQKPQPFVYLSLPQMTSSGLAGQAVLVVRADGDPLALVQPLRAMIHQLDARLPVLKASRFDRFLSNTLLAERAATSLAGFSGLVTLLLAMVGLYGVLSAAVERRRGELGLRLALGAAREDLLRLVLGQGLAPAALGVGIGLAVALALAWVGRGMLFEVSPADPTTYLAVVVVLLIAAWAACLLPARRAAKLDPAALLKTGE